MREPWERCYLGDLADFINGFGFSASQWSQLGRPIVRIENMRSRNAPANRYAGVLPARYSVDHGDLLFSWSGTIMALVWDHEPSWVNQHIFKVEPRENVDRRFLYHLLVGTADRLSANAHGTTMKHVKRNDLVSLGVVNPPLPEQRKIAETLDFVDESIRLAERAITKLAQVKRGVLQDLLPLGSTPRDWRLLTMRELTSKIVDGVHATPRYVRNGVPFVTVENLTRTQGISLDPCRYITTADHRAFSARADPRPGDVLVSKDGTLGVARVVGEQVEEFSIFVSVALLRPRPNYALPDFVAAFFDSDNFRHQLGAQSAGSGLKHIHLNQFEKLVLPVPSIAEQHRILSVLGDADAQIKAKASELVKLKGLKLGLMDDLLTGRVRVMVD